MIEYLKNLLSPSEETAGEFSQSQVEAIVDLLLLCEYADNHLSLLEENFISDTAKDLSWSSSKSIDYYVNSVNSTVREVRNDSKLRSEFMQSAAQRLETREAKQRALELCKSLFKVDGEVTEKETLFASELESSLAS